MAERVFEIKVKTDTDGAVSDVNELGHAIEEVGDDAKKAQSSASKSLNKIGQEAKKSAQDTEQAFAQAQDKVSSALDVFTGGLFGQFKAIKEGIQATFPAFKGLRGAILATGLGALLVLVGELIANFDAISNWFTGVTRRVNALEQENKMFEKRNKLLNQELVALEGQQASYSKIFAARKQLAENDIRIAENQLKIAEELDDQEATTEALNTLDTKRLELARLINSESQRKNAILDEARKLTDEEYAAEQAQYDIGRKFRDEEKSVQDQINEILRKRKTALSSIEKQERIIREETEKFGKANTFSTQQIERDRQTIVDLDQQYTALLKEQILLKKAIKESENEAAENQDGKVDGVKKEVSELDKIIARRERLDELETRPAPERIESPVDQMQAPEMIDIDMEAMREVTDNYWAELQRRFEMEKEFEQMRFEAKKQATEGIINLFGAESKAGRAATVLRQVLAAQEMITEAKKTLTFATQASAQSAVAVQTGFAKTLAAGFPQNIPLLAGYAVQAAGIIAAIRNAVRGAKGQTDISAPSVGGGGFGGGGQAPNPANAVDLNFLNQQPPVQAYVLQDDLKSNAEASQRIRDLASL